MTRSYLKIIDSPAVIGERINEAISQHLNGVINKSKSLLSKKLRSLVGDWITEQPEIISLAGSDLAAHFGLPAGSAGSVIDSIVTSIQNSTVVEITRVDRHLKGGIALHFQPDNFAKLLSLEAGHVRIEESGDLHWLKWLLESGNKIIVVNYHFTAAPDKGRSRGGVMTKGGSWRVPPQYAGTLGDNFVTRAFSGREDDIAKLVNDIFKV